MSLGLNLGLNRSRRTGKEPLGGIVSSCEFDLDATVGSSYPGSGNTWFNLEPSPSSGVSQSAYDVTGVSDPVFSGGAGVRSSYWACDGTFYFTGTNTAFIETLHKSAAGTFYTVAFAFQTASGTGEADSFFGTADANGDYGVQVRSDSSEALKFKQFDGTDSSTNQYSDADLSGATDYLAFMVVDTTAGNVKWAINSRTLDETDTLGWDATSNDATYDFCIGAEGNGGSILNNGVRLYGAYFFNAALTDTQISSVVSHLNLRHGRTYA